MTLKREINIKTTNCFFRLIYALFCYAKVKDKKSLAFFAKRSKIIKSIESEMTI